MIILNVAKLMLLFLLLRRDDPPKARRGYPVEVCRSFRVLSQLCPSPSLFLFLSLCLSSNTPPSLHSLRTIPNTHTHTHKFTVGCTMDDCTASTFTCKIRVERYNDSSEACVCLQISLCVSLSVLDELLERCNQLYYNCILLSEKVISCITLLW